MIRMLDIFNHFAVFGVLFVVLIFVTAIVDEVLGIVQIVDGFKYCLFIAAVCEILAWSIWYLAGGGV